MQCTRRIVETAEHLVDHVFAREPARQCVPAFPWLLRVLFAARPEALTRVLNVVARAVFGAVLKRARLTALARHTSGVSPNSLWTRSEISQRDSARDAKCIDIT